MRNGLLSSKTRQAPALGAVTAAKEIPWQCWDAAGFKDCHAVAWNEARSKCEWCQANPNDLICQGTDPVLANCISNETKQLVWNNCVGSFCPQQDPSVSYLVNYAPYVQGDACNAANTIKNVQWKIGVSADGKWGPLSTSAMNTLKNVQGTTYCDLVPGCSGALPSGVDCNKVAAAPLPPAPIPVTPPAPVVVPKPEPAPVTTKAQPPIKAGMGAGGIVALLAAGALGVYGYKKGWF